MTRRTDIILTLDKIRAAKNLVAKQDEFIQLAKSIGYRPFYAETTLKRFRDQLANSREDLKRLTKAQLRRRQGGYLASVERGQWTSY